MNTQTHPGGVLRSGLDADSQSVYGEDRDEFRLLQQEYFDRFQPRAPEERFLVDTLLRNEWTLRRLFRAESHLWEHEAAFASRTEPAPLGLAFTRAADPFTRLQRRITLAERSYKEALTELRRLQAGREPAIAAEAPQPAPPLPAPTPPAPPLPAPQRPAPPAENPEAARQDPPRRLAG